MVAGGLQGEKWCGVKPLSTAPQSHVYVMSQPEVACREGPSRRG
jgi:hypothetical protein